MNDEALVAKIREVAETLRSAGQAGSLAPGMMRLPERLVIPRTLPVQLEMAAARLEQLSGGAKEKEQ